MVPLGVCLRETGDGALALCLEGLELLLCDLEVGLRARERRLLLLLLRRPLLRVLDGARACPRQILIARGLLLREDQRRLRLFHLGLAGGDLCLLYVELRVDVPDAGLSARHLRLRLIERDPIVALVDLRDHIAGVDVLVVGYGHRRDVSRHLRRNSELPRRNEGVVGRLEMLGVIPVEIAARRRRNEEKEPEQESDRVPSQETPARRISTFAILSRMVILSLSGRFHDAPLPRGTLLRRRRPGASATGSCSLLVMLAWRPVERPDLLLPRSLKQRPQVPISFLCL